MHRSILVTKLGRASWFIASALTVLGPILEKKWKPNDIERVK